MFIKTVSASELRGNVKENLEMVKENQVLQILHRGDGVKVMMTQDYFFNILQRARLYEEMINPEKRNNSNIEKTFTKKELIKRAQDKLSHVKEKLLHEPD